MSGTTPRVVAGGPGRPDALCMTTRRIAALAIVAGLALAAPAAAQDAPPTATPPSAVTPPPAEAGPPSRKAERVRREMRQARKRCAKHPRARGCGRASRPPVSSKSGSTVYLGQAGCTGGQVQAMYIAPPNGVVGAGSRGWVEHWNAVVYSAGSQQMLPDNWVGPFFSHPAYPGWFLHNNTWTHVSRLGGFSRHTLMGTGVRANGYQYVRLHATGEVAQAQVATNNCAGTFGYFNN